MSTFFISKVSINEAATIAEMVQQLLQEIMTITGSAHFHVELPALTRRCEQFIADGIYTVFMAADGAGNMPAGFISLTETHSLYAEGAFGIIPELYVQPQYRAAGAGQLLVDAAKAYGRSRGWQRLEVTTPPLPAFERT